MAEREALRILLVDDDPAVARLVLTVLQGGGFAEPTHVTLGAEALAQAEQSDIVLLDHQLPDMSGLAVLEALAGRPTAPAVVVITGQGSETLAAQALRLGAEDYLIKDASLPSLLPQVIERIRRLRALRAALLAAEHDLVRAERHAAIGEMMVTLTHELNNPLMSATAEVDLLLTQADALTKQQRASVASLQGTLARMADILRRAGNLRSADTADYLTGIKMIDLARPTQPSAVLRGTAVLYLPDDDLARIVRLLLRHAGFTVERAHSIGDLTAMAHRLGVVLVVMAGGDTTFHPTAGRGYTLVALGGPVEGVAADHVVGLPFDPDTFTTEILAAMDDPPPNGAATDPAPSPD